MRTVLLAVIAMSCVLTGCTNESDVAHGTSLDPEAVTSEWIQAATQKNEERFLSLLTGAARQGLESRDGFDMTEQAFEEPDIGSATVTGDTAECPVTATQGGERQTFHVQLKRQKGAWRVFGVKVPMGDVGSMAVNFENFGSMMEEFAETMASEMAASFERAQIEHTQREIRNRRVAYESLTEVDLEGFRTSWQNAVDYRGKTARVAVAELAEKLGLETHLGGHAERFTRTVSTDVRGMSGLAALDAVVEECGLHPVFPSASVLAGGADFVNSMGSALGGMLTSENSAIKIEGEVPSEPAEMPTPPPPGAITFETGTRPGHWVHSGPFLVCVTEINERVPYARGTAHVEIHAHGLDAGVVGLFDDLSESVRFDRIVDADGNSLEYREDVRYLGGGVVAGESYSSSTSVNLKNLVRRVTKIRSIEGVMPVLLPLAVSEATFVSPKVGNVQKVGGLTVSVTQVGQSTSFEITGSEQELAELIVCSRALDSAGQDIQVHYESTNQWMKNKAQYQLQAAATPAEIHTKIVTRRKILEVPFAVADIPLSRHAEMPETLAQLSFSGQSPVTVRFRGFDETDYNMPNARLEVSNHSNKDIERLQANFVYLDANGKSIKDFPHTINGTYTMQGATPVALKGKKETVETTAFFRPNGCTRLRVDIVSIEFMDGTQWEQEQ